VKNQASYQKGVVQLVGFSLVTAACLFGFGGYARLVERLAFMGVGMVVAG